jgi:hypothetical protein
MKQVKFEFGHGSIILDKVIPLERWKKMKFSVSAFLLWWK